MEDKLSIIRKSISAILFIYCNVLAIGANISGKITDKSGQPFCNAIVFNTSNFSSTRTDDGGFFTISAEIGDSLYFKKMYDRFEHSTIVSREDLSISINNIGRKTSGIIPSLFIHKIASLYYAQRYQDCYNLAEYYYDSNLFTLFDKNSYKDKRKQLSVMLYGISSAKALYSQGYHDIELYFYLSNLSSKFIEHLKTEHLISPPSLSRINEYLLEIRVAFSSSYQLLEYYSSLDIKNKTLANELVKLKKIIFKELDPLLYSFKEIDPYTTINIVNTYRSCISHHGSKQKVIDTRFLLLYKEIELIEYYLTSWNIKSAQYADDDWNFQSFYEYNIFEKGPIGFSKAGKSTFMEYANNVCTEATSLYTDLFYEKIDISERSILDLFFKRDRIQQIISTGNPNVPLITTRDIQNKMLDTDCVEYLYEGMLMEGSIYDPTDPSTRFRRYAFIFTKATNKIEHWHKGYAKSGSLNDNLKIESEHPNISRYFILGAKDLAYTDYVGCNSKIHQVMSVYDMMKRLDQKETKIVDILFVGDLNYKEISNMDYSLFKGDESHYELRGSQQEIQQIRLLYPKVEVLCGNDACKQKIIRALSLNKSVIHISTHGEAPDLDLSDVMLVFTGEDIMNNYKLLLSGYDDNPNRSENFLSGSDVLKLKRSNVDLVFLDACSSGIGRYNSSHTGMAYAFKSIGVKNVICYLEPVEDSVATSFSNKFYELLSCGKSYHDAFYDAKKEICPETKIVLWE